MTSGYTSYTAAWGFNVPLSLIFPLRGGHHTRLGWPPSFLKGFNYESKDTYQTS